VNPGFLRIHIDTISSPTRSTLKNPKVDDQLCKDLNLLVKNGKNVRVSFFLYFSCKEHIKSQYFALYPEHLNMHIIQ
jgi:hypothetical protein